MKCVMKMGGLNEVHGGDVRPVDGVGGQDVWSV